ncbi:MAG: hypothetical protein R3350_01440 [Saprospiraceae bacterium]|nr:hypothetical protein [Saprospiraceae bacterium]
MASKKINPFHLLTIFLLSIVLIALQLLIMRALSVSRYYHFTYLVISTALLGFGASGTFLTFWYDRMARHFSKWSLVILTLFLLSIPFTYLGAQALPIDIQYMLYSGKQQLWLLLYNLLMFIPFFLGGVAIGFYLSYFQKNAPVLYGSNLIGSGAGALLALWFMFQFPAYQLPVKITIVAFLVVVSQLLSDPGTYFGRRPLLALTALVLSGAAALGAMLARPETKVDQYKTYYHLEQLRQQGDARKLETRYGPRAQIDVYISRRIHQTLFAGLQSRVMPPPQLSVLIDGESAGAIFRVDSLGETSIMKNTPQSVPYRLADRPKVLLLGEVTGNNVWLARHFGARQITVVQNNPQMIGLLQKELADSSGRVFLQPEVEVVDMKPRLFLQRNREMYDIIQLVSGESMAAGTHGLQSLNEDYLLTVEGIQACLEDLAEDGMVSITRGIQTPPRDNIKLFALFAEALRGAGIDRPGDHLLQARNYLAMNTILTRVPMGMGQLDRYRQACREQLMDFEHYPGIRADTLTQTNEIEGPEGKNYSWFHYASRKILADSAEALYDSWMYNVAPPTDNKPYFSNFFKWSSVDRIAEIYGKHWFQRLELGYMVLVITFLEVFVVAFFLILWPLFFLRKRLKNTGDRLPTLLHFGAIGLGFMFLEMVFIQQFTNFMGDPVYSVAVAMTAILVFSGIGSSIQKRLPWPPARRIRIAGILIVLIALLFLLFLDPLLFSFAGWPLWGRFIVTLVLLFPLTFMLGWMFVSGIGILEDRSPELVPWAWGVNGFASVVGAPLAVMLSMSWGFAVVVLLAAALYGLTVWNTRWWGN